MAPLKEQKLDPATQRRLARAGVRPRRFLFTQEFENWVKTELRNIPSTKTWGVDVPAQRQVATIVNQFMCGDRLHVPSTLRCMLPQSEGVWELKTGDVRVFGWFAAMPVESSLFDDGDPRLAASDLCVARICTRLRLALADSGLRQIDVAKKLSVKPAVVSRWLSGRSNIGIRALSDLAWAIGCELDVDFVDIASGRRTAELRSPA